MNKGTQDAGTLNKGTMKKSTGNSTLQDAFEQHRDALLGYIRKRLNDFQQADDLLHDLYIKLQTQQTDTLIQYPKAYLYRMANNLVIDFQRHQNRQPVADDSEADEQENELSPERMVSDAEQLTIVKAAIEELPDKTREVFKLQRLQQLDKADVASRTGISVNMVEKHLRKAVRFCRDKLYRQTRERQDHDP